VAVTAGAGGAALLLDGEFAEAPAPQVDVIDTIGAGDAFTAAMIDGILRDLPTDVVLRPSISLGTLVASRPGAMPAWTADDFREFEWRAAEAIGRGDRSRPRSGG
jgi:sugar/nucleoside kinase (ribokinase family)